MQALRIDGTEHDLQRMAQRFPNGAVLEGEGAHRRLLYDNKCVRGSALSLGMRLGMRMQVADFEGILPLALEIEHAPTELEFSFSLGKGSRCVTENGEQLDFGGGRFHVGRIACQQRLSVTTSAGSRDQSIHLKLTGAVLRELLGVEQLPRKVEETLTATEPMSLFGAEMDSRMFSIAEEVFAATAGRRAGERSVGQCLFLEGKALELVAVLCDRLSDDERAVRNTPDWIRLHQARGILVAQWENPPNPSELARSVGMGERRLKAGFRELFGAPVMSYARRVRLEHARDLLSSNHHNVTQVAHLVGYSNPSKFAAAYRRQFGVSPSAC